MTRMNPLVGVVFILCIFYCIFGGVFLAEHPHAFDCSDHVICPDATSTNSKLK